MESTRRQKKRLKLYRDITIEPMLLLGSVDVSCALQIPLQAVRPMPALKQTGLIHLNEPRLFGWHFKEDAFLYKLNP